MKFSDETLMAYADGELDEAGRAEIERALDADPALANAYAALTGTRKRSLPLGIVAAAGG